MTKTFNRHMVELDSGFYGKGFIRGLRMALNRRGRAENGYSVSRSYGGMKPAEIDALSTRIHDNPPRIRDDQAAQGLAWLRDTVWTPKGTERKTNVLDDSQVECLRNFDHFEFVDWYDTGIHSQYPWYIPIYRVVDKAGGFFDYYAGSWQSGIPLTIL